MKRKKTAHSCKHDSQFFLPFHMALNSYILSCALIVRNTFGFRSLGILGCEGENNHGCDKRHHAVNVLGQSQMGEDGGVRNVCQGTEYRKEYSCSGNVERFPLTEDHNSEGKESGTGYADFEIPGGNGRNDVGKSASALMRGNFFSINRFTSS